MDVLKITMMILFCNMFLSAVFPDLVLGDNILYTMSDDGASINSEYTDIIQRLTSDDGGFLSVTGFIDSLKLLWAFFGLIIRFFTASLIIVWLLPGWFSLFLGVPIITAYGFAIAGVFR